MHIDSGNLVIVVAGIIGDALFKVVAGTIDGDFEFGGVEFGLVGATGLIDGMKNMEILANAGQLVFGGVSVLFGEGGFDKARLGIHAARKEFGAETTTIVVKYGRWGDGILWVGRRDGLVVGEIN